MEYKVQIYSLKDDTTPVVEMVTTEDQWAPWEGEGAHEAMFDPPMDAIDYVASKFWEQLRPRRHRRSGHWKAVVNGETFDLVVHLVDGEFAGTDITSTERKSS